MNAEQPHALVLDDGELHDVRAALRAIGVALLRRGRRDSASARCRCWSRRPRARARSARRAGGAAPPPAPGRHRIRTTARWSACPATSRCGGRSRARCCGCSRERAGYEGPERRRSTRVAIGAPVVVQRRRRRREAILAQVSVGGCGLVAARPARSGRARCRSSCPRELTAPRRLVLSGRVLGARRTTTADGETFDVSVAFDALRARRPRHAARADGGPADRLPPARPTPVVDEAGPTCRPRLRRGGARLGAARAEARAS